MKLSISKIFPEVGVTALTNAAQCYVDISYLQRIYNPGNANGEVSVKTTQTTTTVFESSTPESNRRPSVTALTSGGSASNSAVTPLSARTFGTWNAAVAIARLYASYNLHEKSWYQMSIWTNIIGLVHFGLEAFVYRTCRPRGPWFAPTTLAVIGLVWHVLQYDYYVKQ